MNIRFVIARLGQLFMLLGLSMGLVVALEVLGLTGTAGDERAGIAGLVGAGALGLVSGLAMWLAGRAGADRFFGRREAMLLVALAWVLGSALCALPFWGWGLTQPGHVFNSPIDCYFESVSGLTTTGSSVLSVVEEVPRSLLLWRSTTHWLGGLGIVVLFVAVFPTLGVGARRLFGFESSAKTAMDDVTHIRSVARKLYLVYIGLTVIQALLLKLCGLDWFESICETFGSIASGGFSTKTQSLTAYHSLSVEIICIVFMILSGLNFGLYLALLRGRWKQVWKDQELRLFLITTFGGMAIVSASLVGKVLTLTDGSQVHAGIGAAIRHGSFQLVSLRTTTGFATADFNNWPFIAHATLLTMMFMGACTGSTGGGYKVLRVLILFRVLARGVERMFRPNVVRPIRIGGLNVEDDMALETLGFIIAYTGFFFIGSVLVMALEPSPQVTYVTAATACGATITNSGPGLGLVGAAGNFGWMTGSSKLVLSLLMIVGRLEVYVMLGLLLPGFWKRG